MSRLKRRVISSKVPQKIALSAYKYSPSKSPSPDEAHQPPGSADSDRGQSTAPDSPNQDEDPNESGTDQSHTTSSSGDFPRIPVRPRQRFTTDETAALEQVYRRNKRPSNEIKQRLSRRFGTSVSRIQIWFQNRRAKEKKTSRSSNNQRASTAANEQEEDDDDDDAPSSDDPKQPELSTSAATFSSSPKRLRASRASSVSPPVVTESSSSAARKHKKQKMPVVNTNIPVTHSFLPSGSYTFTYPGFATTMQFMDHTNVSNTTMPSESFLYPGHPPQHPSHARGGFFVPKFDWHPQHIIHPSFAPALQGPHPTEKPLKYVDPKKVVQPEPSQPEFDHVNEQGATSNSRSHSRKGKQQQKAAEMVDSGSEQSSCEQ